MIPLSKKSKPLKHDGEYTVPLYGGTVYLFKTKSKLHKAQDYLGCVRTDLDNCAGQAIMLFKKETSEVVYIIGVFNNNLSTLAHECSHVTLFISEYAGIVPIESSGEPFCYLLGDKFEKLHTSFKES